MSAGKELVVEEKFAYLCICKDHYTVQVKLVCLRYFIVCILHLNKEENDAIRRKNRMLILKSDGVSSFNRVVLKCFPVTRRMMRLPRRSQACEAGFRHKEEHSQRTGKKFDLLEEVKTAS